MRSEEIVEDEYKAENLLLLIGANPLPNYVAGKILLKPETRLHLMVSPEVSEPEIHKRLVELLGRDPKEETQYLHINPTDPDEIYVKVFERVNGSKGSWDLNYTGGKKSMALQAYCALEQALPKTTERFMTYLDVDHLSLFIGQPGLPTIEIPINPKLEVRLEEILELHGRPLTNPSDMRLNPFQPGFCYEMVGYCQDTPRRKEWNRWINASSKSTAGETFPADLPIIGGKSIEEVETEWQKGRKDLLNWLNGHWLEDYVLDQILKVKEDASIHQAACSIKPKGLLDFEIDVAAMKGYQLYAISATTSPGKKTSKLKLFEAMIRAQHMGGEEAKAGLVTFYNRPEELRKEVGQNLVLTQGPAETGEKDTKPQYHSPVGVWGIEQLPELSNYLKQWFKEVS